LIELCKLIKENQKGKEKIQLKLFG